MSVAELIKIEASIQPDKNQVGEALSKKVLGEVLSNGANVAKELLSGGINFSPATKAERETSKKQINDLLRDRYGVKFSEKKVEEILEHVSIDTHKVIVGIVPDGHEDRELLFENMPKPTSQQLKRAVEGMDIVMVYCTEKDGRPYPIYMYLPLADGLYKPFFVNFVGEDENSSNLWFPIVKEVETVVAKFAKYAYETTLKGPRGGSEKLGCFKTNREIKVPETHNLENGYSVEVTP